MRVRDKVISVDQPVGRSLAEDGKCVAEGALVPHEGWIILWVETGMSSGHICDTSRTLRIDGRSRRHDTGSTGLGDGSKNVARDV